MTGTIVRIIEDRGFGFVEPDDDSFDRDLFFHCKSLKPDLIFDSQLIQRRVQFDVVDSDRGYRAENVRGI